MNMMKIITLLNTKEQKDFNMNTLEQELNLIALEIINERPNIEKAQQELINTSQPKNRGEKINLGFNFMKFNQLTYSFIRFYKIADKSKLSQESINIANTFVDEIEEAKKYIKQKDLPKELTDFLNN